MTLLISLFGYLSIILHGLAITAQSLALGGVLFLVALVRPFEQALEAGPLIRRRVTAVIVASAVGLVLIEITGAVLQLAVLIDTVDLPLGDALQTGFVLSAAVRSVCSAALVFAVRLRRPAPSAVLLALVALELAAATATTHAAARVEISPWLLIAEWLHQLGAAIWIGGLPCFLLALGQVRDAAGWRTVAARFSRMSMLGVALILASGLTMTLAFIGSVPALYGTAYGLMVAAKAAMFGGLLLLGAGNFLVTERLRRDPGAPVIRMKRFAEVELGIGLSIFFAAASLTSVPPAVDLSQDRVSLQQIVERNSPVWPRLTSPDHDSLALPALQQRLDAEAAQSHSRAATAFVPGDEEITPRNAADIAWSEYNHHWAGLAVVLIGALVLAQHAGVRAARHWPVVFLALGLFILVRADPEVWPMGEGSFWAAWRDVEVLQHRLFMLLVLVFAGFEWAVQTRRIHAPRAALVFPLMVAAGGALLLTHSHQVANVQDATLIEMSHTPLALLGIAAGWAAWLEVRLPGRAGRTAGWAWGCCFVLVGLVLLLYREA